jgi:hypothetical protein
MKSVFVIGFLFSQITLANWDKLPSTDFPISPPPEKNSQAYEQDFQLVKKYQEIRSKKDCDLASAQKHPAFDAIFLTHSYSPLRKKKQRNLSSAG